MFSFFWVVCRMLTFLFMATSFYCYSTTDSLTAQNFKKDWENFIVNNGWNGELAHADSIESQFSLISEFSTQQYSRRRPYSQTIDRHKCCRPYQDNQIVLSNGVEMSASLILTGELESRYQSFIASQAPLQQSVHYFWQMILEKEIDQVVMVTEFEDLDQGELATPYWPMNLGESLFFENNLMVTFIDEIKLNPHLEEHIHIRKFHLIHEGNKRIVTHYWYRNWIDGSIPRQSETISDFIQMIEKDKSLVPSVSPILVHCSGGVGRTGVFMVLYHLMERKKFGDSKINLFNFVASLRWQRPYLVSRLSQYEYCHQVNDQLFNIEQQAF